MLNFSFTEEQEFFRKMLKDFAKEELLPNYTKWDREGITPRHLWKKLGQLGVNGLRIPVEYGGSGADCVVKAIQPSGVSYRRRSSRSTPHTLATVRSAFSPVGQ